MMGIYEIRNRKNNKRYIGSTNNTGHRKAQHWRALRGHYHPNNHLQNAWGKYGEQVFVFEVIEEIVDEHQLLSVEQCYLDKEQPEYNKSMVAESSFRGKKHSAESRKLISKNHADFSGEKHPSWGKQVSEKTKQKISNSLKGRKLPAWHREKIRKTTRKGENHPNARLSCADVVKIRKDYASGEMLQSEIANKYGIERNNVCQIVNRRTWKHI